MIFLQPEHLWLLLPGALFVLLIAWRRKKPYFAHPLLFHMLGKLQPPSRLTYLPKTLELLALCALLLALLDPVLPSAQYAVSNEGLDIVLTVDLSSSMEEPIDMVGALRRERQGIIVKEKTRLDAVKEAMVQFVQTRRTDRFGVVVFSEEGYVVVPMTNDIPYVTRYLKLIDLATLAGEGQTAIGEGVWTAMEQAQSQSQSQARNGAGGHGGKVIVVLTDGENNTGRDAVQAIKAAGEAGFRVHFIGVELERAKGAQQVMAAVRGTGGKYYDVRKESELLQAYFDIDHMEKARFVSVTQVKNIPNYAPFVLTALGLLAAGMLLRTRGYFTELS